MFSFCCLGILFCFFAGTMRELVAARFFQALGAAAGGVIARAMVRDVFNGKKAAQAQSFINLAFSFTPLMAPLFGGYLLIFFWMAFNFSCTSSFWNHLPFDIDS